MKTVNVGIRISQHVLDKLDKHKGYYSRNRYLCKILDDYTTQLEREEEEKESNNKK